MTSAPHNARPRSVRVAGRGAFATAGALLAVAVLGGCGSSGSPTSARSTTTRAGTTTLPVATVPATSARTVAPTTVAPTTVAPTTVATTTVAPTTVALPVSPQASASTAAAALVSSWASGDRATALTVATAAAVTALFASPYPTDNAVPRGCSDEFPPLVCSYGPPGGGSGTLYQLYVTQIAAGWYVSSVVVEN